MLYELKANSVTFNVYVQKKVIVNHFMEVCPLIYRREWVQFFDWMSFSFYTDKTMEKAVSLPCC